MMYVSQIIMPETYTVLYVNYIAIKLERKKKNRLNSQIGKKNLISGSKFLTVKNSYQKQEYKQTGKNPESLLLLHPHALIRERRQAKKSCQVYLNCSWNLESFVLTSVNFFFSWREKVFMITLDNSVGIPRVLLLQNSLWSHKNYWGPPILTGLYLVGRDANPWELKLFRPKRVSVFCRTNSRSFWKCYKLVEALFSWHLASAVSEGGTHSNTWARVSL